MGYFTQGPKQIMRTLNIYIERNISFTVENQPAAQAAGTDPSRCTAPLGKITPFTKIDVTFELR